MHILSPELLRRTVRTLVVGCGGSGSAIASGLPYLHQAMLVAGHPGGLHLTVADGDLISATNCVRQPFARAEIGLSKAVVLVSRLNLFWGLNWTAEPAHLDEKSDISTFDLVIGCVDTRRARKLIEQKVSSMRSRVAFWLDLGNSASSGQFVLGQPLNGCNPRRSIRLRVVSEILPEIVDDSLDENDGPSCSALESLEKQEPFVNTVLAQHALALLAQLFRYGSVKYHGAFVDVAANRVQPIPIDAVVWRQMRRRGLRRKPHQG